MRVFAGPMLRKKTAANRHAMRVGGMIVGEGRIGMVSGMGEDESKKVKGESGGEA